MSTKAAQKRKDLVRDTTKQINSQRRGLEREVNALKRDEQKLITQIKAAAKKPGSDKIVKILAKELVKNRNAQAKITGFSTKMNTTSTMVKTMAATQAAAESMGASAKVMGKMNAQMDVQKVQKNMMNFEKQNDMMNMKEDMIDDMMDMMDDDDIDEEQDELVAGLMDEIGLDLSAQMTAAPSTKVGVAQRAQSRQQEEELVLPSVPGT